MPVHDDRVLFEFLTLEGAQAGYANDHTLTASFMDYDLTNLPAGYDRARDHGPELLSLWMDAIASHLDRPRAGRILDLGCGTGRFTTALSDRFDADVVGVDPSAKMLARANEKRRSRRVLYTRGSAEAIPLPSHSVDLVFMSMSFHHFTDPVAAARECHRVVRDGGRVFVRTGTREQIHSYPYVRFFPSSPGIIRDTLPDVAGLRQVFATAGFACVSAALIEQTIAPNWAAYAEKLSAGGDSVLARMSRPELEDGLAAVRRYAAERGDQTVVEQIDLLVFE